jgi:hypothetical protein
MTEPFVISSDQGQNPLPAVIITDQGELRLNLSAALKAEQIVLNRMANDLV